MLQILTSMTGLGMDFEDDFFFEEDKMLVDCRLSNCSLINNCAIFAVLSYSLDVLFFW